MNPTRGLVTFAILHHVLAAAAILLLGTETKMYSAIVSVGAFGFLSVIVRRGWQVAADAEISPGKAQGFLFIPFFNFYWIFRALPGLTKALSRRAEQVGAEGGKRLSGFALTVAILFCVRGVTLSFDSLALLDGLLYLVYVGFSVVFIWQVIGAAKALEASAPESKPMGTLPVAAIVLGPLVALLGLLLLGEFYARNDIGAIERKGYRTVVSDVEGATAFQLRQDGIILKRLNVMNSADDRIGTVLFVNLEGLSESQVARLEREIEAPGERLRGVYYFRAARRDLRKENMPIRDWIASF